MAMRSQTQRTLLFGFIGSIALCGLLGVYCLLVGQMGVFEGKVLGTTAVFGAASILGLASVVPWEKRRWHPIGPVSIAVVGIALVLVVIAIWCLPFSRRWEEFYLRVMGIACVWGLAFPHVALLSLARLRSAYEWVRRSTVWVVVILAGAITYQIIVDFDDSDLWGRVIGILAIADVCGTITIPVLHRVSAIRLWEGIRTVELEVALTCPRCHMTQTLRVGRSACASCQLKFRIEIEEEHCETCGYPLYKLESSQCPECGTPIAIRVADGISATVDQR